MVRNYKTKENCVVDKIRDAFPDLSWIADKKVQDGCSKRRPDLLLDLGSHVLIIETFFKFKSNPYCEKIDFIQFPPLPLLNSFHTS